jgi:hypothetical protein
MSNASDTMRAAMQCVAAAVLDVAVATANKSQQQHKLSRRYVYEAIALRRTNSTSA